MEEGAGGRAVGGGNLSAEHYVLDFPARSGFGACVTCPRPLLSVKCTTYVLLCNHKQMETLCFSRLLK